MLHIFLVSPYTWWQAKKVADSTLRSFASPLISVLFWGPCRTHGVWVLMYQGRTATYRILKLLCVLWIDEAVFWIPVIRPGNNYANNWRRGWGPILFVTIYVQTPINHLNPELNPICYLLALLAHHFLHVSRIRVKLLTLRRLMSYIYGAPILDVSRSHTTTQHSR